MWTIAGQSMRPGEKRQLTLDIGVPGYEQPVTLICGARPGKTAAVTAGIHSGEFPGTAAVARVARRMEPADMAGSLILFHCVNVGGYWAGANSRVPEDGANLNANYPGDERGGPGDRIAAFFVREIFPKIDFLLDMHSGSLMEELTPCLFFPACEPVRQASLEAAMSMDIPLLIESTSTRGEYSYAASFCGVPALLVERGHSGQCRKEWVDAYERDLQLLLHHLGMTDFAGEPPAAPRRVYRKTIYLTSDFDGMWQTCLTPGQRVRKGDLLGVVSDFFGNPLAEYRAREDGTVFYFTSGLSIRKGRPLVAYGLESLAYDL